MGYDCYYDYLADFLIPLDYYSLIFWNDMWGHTHQSNFIICFYCIIYKQSRCDMNFF